MAEAEAETAALSRLTPSVLRFSRFLLILPFLFESTGGARAKAAEGVAEREAAADGPFEERIGEDEDDEDVTTVVAGWLE